jgi:hypothetical protein
VGGKRGGMRVFVFGVVVVVGWSVVGLTGRCYWS